jgi:hypothetical protein
MNDPGNTHRDSSPGTAGESALKRFPSRKSRGYLVVVMLPVDIR